jgi:hypothetical protein
VWTDDDLPVEVLGVRLGWAGKACLCEAVVVVEVGKLERLSLKDFKKFQNFSQNFFFSNSREQKTTKIATKKFFILRA